MPEHRVEIVELLASPVRRYEGRPGAELDPTTPDELVDAITLRAGLGIVGDRYFNKPAHRDASVTIQSVETLTAIAESIGSPVPGLAATRRNILVRGVEVEQLVGQPLSLDSGDGEVAFAATGPVFPCAWMNVVVGEGALRAFRGRGGLRTSPLVDGVLRRGSAVLRVGEAVSRR